MNQSDVILKTYREITTLLQKPYYVLEAIPANKGRNNMLYSSPALKDVTGLTQFDLASNPQRFLDSIHPEYIDDYLKSNQRLVAETKNERRIYLVKNKDTGNFIPVEEIASSRLNTDRNCYEIYCCLRSINEDISDVQPLSTEDIAKIFSTKLKVDTVLKTQIYEIAQYFVETFTQNFKVNACRFYGFNHLKNELTILGDNQNKKSKQTLESISRIRTKNIVPKYSEDSLFFQELFKKEYTIIEDKEDIVQILRDHTDSIILKKLAGPATKIYNINSFGILPLCCSDGKIAGLVTFGSPQTYDEDTQKSIFDFTNTTASIFTGLLEGACK